MTTLNILGEKLTTYMNRQKDHLNMAEKFENEAKLSRARATACAGAIEAVQELMTELSEPVTGEAVEHREGANIHGIGPDIGGGPNPDYQGDDADEGEQNTAKVEDHE